MTDERLEEIRECLFGRRWGLDPSDQLDAVGDLLAEVRRLREELAATRAMKEHMAAAVLEGLKGTTHPDDTDGVMCFEWTAGHVRERLRAAQGPTHPCQVCGEPGLPALQVDIKGNVPGGCKVTCLPCAARLEERERCARLVEAADPWIGREWAGRVAAAIRAGEGGQ